MTEYTVVPSLHASPWAKPGAPMIAALEGWPRVGIYCPHEPAPWLIGSFVLDEEASERAGAPYWSWTLDYPTGDGHLIRLGRNGERGRAQYIVDDAERDRGAEKAEVRRATLSGDASELEAVTRAIDHRESNTRARIPMMCGTCGLSRTFRAEHLHRIASTFWAVEYREVPLTVFARRVDRRA